MQKWLKKGFVLLLTGSLLFTGCQPRGNDASTVNSTDTKEMDFDAFAKEIFAKNVSSDALTLHCYVENPENFGIASSKNAFSRITLDDDDLKAETEENKRLLEQLRSYKKEDLDEDQRITYEVLENNLQNALSAEGLEFYPEVLEPNIGLQSQYPIILSEYKFSARQDIENYLALLADLGGYFDNLIEYEKKRSELGLFMSDAAAEETIKECQDFIANPEDNLLLGTFDEKVNAFEGLSDTEKTDFIEKNRKTVLETVLPAYQSVIDGLTALKGTGTNDKGLYYYERGKDYYLYLLKTSIGTEKTPEELIQLVEDKIAEDFTTMSIIYTKNTDIYTDIQNASYRLDDPDEILKYMKEAIKDNFPDPVEASYTTKNVHPSLADSSSPAMYLIPQIDNYKNNIIYINLSDKYGNEMFPTVCHEGYPGHLYQTTYFYDKKPNPVRMLFSTTGYSEGWACYIEELSYQYSGMKEDVADFMAANYSMSMCLYSRVDIGIHYEGWDKAKTVEYLSQYFNLDDEAVTSIYETILFSPANYLNYCIGSLEIQELRVQAEDTLDDAFDLKEFHKFLLDMGPASFGIIKSHFDEWLLAAQNK